MAGRPQTDRTEPHPNAKISEATAYAIKFNETGSARVVAEKYGVSQAAVYHIRWGKSWAWLKPNYAQLPLGSMTRGRESALK